MKHYLLPSLFLLLFCFSCQEEELLIDSAPIEALENVTVKNDRLHFPSEKEFHLTDMAINDKEPLDLSTWYEQMNFSSMIDLYYQVNEEFSTVENEATYQKFQDKYEGVIYITPNNSLSIDGYHPFFAPILNENGEVYIGNSLVKYTNTHKITILDGAEHKLDIAINTLRSDEEEGIVVELLPFIDPATQASRSCSEETVWQTCSNGSNARAIGHYYLDNYLGTVSSYTIANGNVYDFTTYLRCSIKCQYRGWFGIWYLHRTGITWSIGWGASSNTPSVNPTYAHGTGWTVYNVATLSYNFPLRDIYHPITIRYDQYDTFRYTFDYFYGNISTSAVACSEACN